MKKAITPQKLLAVFILVLLILGVFIVGDYGISIDHSQETDRAEIAMRRYSPDDPGDPIAEYLSLGINQYYGTPQMSLYLLVERAIRPLIHTPEFYIVHYLMFATFLSGIYGCFVLTRRWVSEWAALGAALLFGLQPLFFGHSFINPKDIPSMTVFIITMVIGFKLSDDLSAFMPPPASFPSKLYTQAARQDWDELPAERRMWLLRFGWLWLGTMFLWVARVPDLLIRWGIEAAYIAPESGWLGQLFHQYAPSAASIPAADYVRRAQELFGSLFDPAILMLALTGAALYLWNIRSPQRILWQSILSYFAGRPYKWFWENTVTLHLKAYRDRDRHYWAVALGAGAVWGLAISVRATNITAGGMIGLYILLKYRERAILPLTAYTLTALAATIATWPYLWYFGVQGFIDGMTAFADYPFVDGRVWLRGVIPIEELPATYIPHTMAIQFTEPLVILSLLGIILSLYLAARKKFPRLDLLILLSWFGLPILYTALAHPTLYNNFRQFFFVTPPLFVFSAVMMDWVKQRIKSAVILTVLLLAALTPGIIETIRLHPYQYVYYNQFVGGTEGAAGLYELDYWAISYREVMEFINENTPENGSVMYRGGNDIPAYYVRPDIKLTPISLDTTPEELAQYDYVIMTTNHRHQLEYLNMDDYPTVFEVYAGDTLLAVVKKP